MAKALTALLASLDTITDPVAKGAAAKLRDLAGGTDSAWQAFAIDLAADTVAKHGADGLSLAANHVIKLLEGKETSLDVSDARLSHNLLVAMEKEEDLRRKDVRAFFAKVANVLGELGGVLLAGALKGGLSK